MDFEEVMRVDDSVETSSSERCMAMVATVVESAGYEEKRVVRDAGEWVRWEDGGFTDLNERRQQTFV